MKFIFTLFLLLSFKAFSINYKLTKVDEISSDNARVLVDDLYDLILSLESEDHAKMTSTKRKKTNEHYLDLYYDSSKKIDEYLKDTFRDNMDRLWEIEIPWRLHRAVKAVDKENQYLRWGNAAALKDITRDSRISDKLKHSPRANLYFDDIAHNKFDRFITATDEFINRRRSFDVISTFRFGATNSSDTFGKSIVAGDLVSDKGFLFSGAYPERVHRYFMNLANHDGGAVFKIIGRASIPHVIVDNDSTDTANNKGFKEAVYKRNTIFRVLVILEFEKKFKIFSNKNVVLVVLEEVSLLLNKGYMVKDIYSGKIVYSYH